MSLFCSYIFDNYPPVSSCFQHSETLASYLTNPNKTCTLLWGNISDSYITKMQKAASLQEKH